MPSSLQRSKSLTKAERTAQRQAREDFRANEILTARYQRQLNAVGNVITKMVEAMAAKPTDLARMLQDYARMIEPWAATLGERMVEGAANSSRREFLALGSKMGRELRKEIDDSPITPLLQAARARQVQLITSLPLEMAEKVNALAWDYKLGGGRAKSLTDVILGQKYMARHRAATIARTEISTVTARLSEARAVNIGCQTWRWATVGDGTVRASHRKMNGTVWRYDDPPIVDGVPTVAGASFNCRCRAVPILPEF
jgi:SPP1 gp7 family putative phage head morphogenesis protein